MEQKNLIQQMLEKGEQLKPAYADFDYGTLAPQQIQAIKHLTWFSQYKQRIIGFFESKKVTREVKVMFLDQHSMKLGDGVFYTLEGKRQGYVSRINSLPYMTAFGSIALFIYFAIRRPLHHKLYKEIALSFTYAALLSAGYINYFRIQYLREVDRQYERLA